MIVEEEKRSRENPAAHILVLGASSRLALNARDERKQR
jgi:hypothetical protein